MKYIFSITLLCTLLLLSSCFNKEKVSEEVTSTPQSQENSKKQVVEEGEGDATDVVDGVFSTPTSKSNMIEIQDFNESTTISSPLTISGIAPVEWVKAGTFPISIADLDGNIIQQGFGNAQTVDENGEPILGLTQYTANFDFSLPEGVNTGKLIFSSSTGEGDERDFAEVPVNF